MNATAVILAAGKGTRMRSDRPKVLHELAGKPLIAYPLGVARLAGAQRAVVVVGHGADEVEAVAREVAPDGLELDFALQAEQLGTGHAVTMALPALAEHEGPVWILSGDVPLLRAQTLELLTMALDAGAALSMLSFRPPDPAAYGRVLRDADGEVTAIREFKDATEAERSVDECNAGVYCIEVERLRSWLPRLTSDNAQGEFYLTDLVELAVQEGKVACIGVPPLEVAGVNTPEQLEALSFAVRAGSRA